MVQDQTLAQAVAAIPQRSERQQDLQKLVGSFVDVGILPQIHNVNNQVIYGRRGTASTSFPASFGWFPSPAKRTYS